MEPKKVGYQHQATSIIKSLLKRGMQGYYFEDKQVACDFVNQQIADHSTVSWGGSLSLSQTGIKQSLLQRQVTVFDIAEAKNEQQKHDIRYQALDSDYYLMSTNAITLDGELVNIDGLGNRVGALAYGPKNIIVVAGMNKVVTDALTGIDRIRNFASPPNCNRLDKKTPCSVVGYCKDCYVDDCICGQIVITRKSYIKNRIMVVLVGEELGF